MLSKFIARLNSTFAMLRRKWIAGLLKFLIKVLEFLDFYVSNKLPLTNSSLWFSKGSFDQFLLKKVIFYKKITFSGDVTTIHSTFPYKQLESSNVFEIETKLPYWNQHVICVICFQCFCLLKWFIGICDPEKKTVRSDIWDSCDSCR